MRIFRLFLGRLKVFCGDKAGNLAIIGALSMPVGLAAVGAALDLATVVSVKSKLQTAADAGAVAAAAYLVNDDNATEEKAKELAKSFIRGQVGSELSLLADKAKKEGEDGFDLDSCTSVTITPTPGYANSVTYDVKVNTCIEKQLTALNVLLGHDMETIFVKSSAQSTTATHNAFSMYLVLDRSGSMAWDTTKAIGEETYTYSCGYRNRYKCTGTRTVYLKKIDALKQAAAQLLAVIDEADPDGLYSRFAAVSYNSSTQTPQDFSWGTSDVLAYVNALPADGGTDSSYAVKTAYQALSGTSEDVAHKAKNGQKPDKYIVFMTDGDNNEASADTATKNWCDSAKASGIEIYTVAFMAPDGGKSLLGYCASGSDHYFEAEDADEMAAAFKYIGEKATDATTRLTH
ncbi:VWA domain-containing protein [Rhizobium sp. L1K21]|uniref:VWA domain-containing protein n=1 Tax=Rhizobium sp. L1K21 TaxID=2954933 RepID=UPI002093C9DA|nr:VWA domain-containing protein [Rhizobium sp. L1K21]MCO6184974.1 VWA domain-containing protein [Rhizobium sp. L1K21]